MTVEMPKDPIKACPVRLCRDGLLWNEAVGDFGCKCPTCGGWGFVHDEEAAEQIIETNTPKQFTINDCIEHCDVVYDRIEKIEHGRKGSALLAVCGLREMLKAVLANKKGKQ